MVLLLANPHWGWLILCGIFLLLEIFTVSFFFLTWASAALVMALLTYFVRMSVPTQMLSFAVFSLIALGLWWIFARHWQKDPNDLAAKLNNRGRALIGRSFVLKRPIEQHYGELHIDDSLWTVYCDEDLPAGTLVTVTDLDSMTLLVRRAA